MLREVKVGESSRLLTLLTAGHGIITVQARGSLNPKNKLFSASGLFCYSEWVLREGRKYYWADEATPIEVFFGLRQELTALSLATYIAELLMILQPTGAEGARLLQLALRGFWLLAEGKRSPALVKTGFEMRAMAESGFLPSLIACENCGKYEDQRVYFDVKMGVFYCQDCSPQSGNMSLSMLTAMRYIVLSELEKVYDFTLNEETLAQLGRIVEQYVLFHLDRAPKSLGFLNSNLL